MERDRRGSIYIYSATVPVFAGASQTGEVSDMRSNSGLNWDGQQTKRGTYHGPDVELHADGKF